MSRAEKENRIHSFALEFLERQQIVPNLYADQIIRGYKEGYHQAEKDLELSWEDIEKIYFLVIETDNEYLEANADNDYEYDVKEMYQEVLKRWLESKKV